MKFLACMGELGFSELWPGRYLVHAEQDGASACAVVELDDPTVTRLDLQIDR